jgi:hypothetical protein
MFPCTYRYQIDQISPEMITVYVTSLLNILFEYTETGKLLRQ